jgi:hypothetical protein
VSNTLLDVTHSHQLRKSLVTEARKSVAHSVLPPSTFIITLPLSSSMLC